ncbi:TetR/AcrR family transcriptional regulator [Tomitella fengzijianii]|uniref:TetR/AcrR family transcriptional regulator n=1 Tax=Tomitella fengzijianii TaxID=2597660 RepID=UPI00131D6489|nr:TetR/AcrR family transcriptional regulator [Tomitella fengzijianii]
MSEPSPSVPVSAPDRRRNRDRQGTERRMLDAARRLLERDGVLAGLNLREVADEAQANRGQVYQYFGSRRELLRAAIAEERWEESPVFFQGDRELPFAERRARVFAETINAEDALRLTTLLMLDGDEDVRLFPKLERSRVDLQRDQGEGHLSSDVDPVVAHAMTAVMNFGYAIFRSQVSKEIGIPADRLDELAKDVVVRMLSGLADS